jgi:hypothetical protein
MQATALALKMSPGNLVGEIVAQRYAVLEYLGVNRFLVYDMEEMRRTVVPLGADGSVLNWDAAPVRKDPTPVLVSVPPPAPPPVPPPIPTAAAKPRRRIDTRRFEAAWYARGEELQFEDEEEAEVTDYVDYQARLEKLALEMP